jgi:RNA polymerase sigma-70 factor (ECF subfamily)
MFTSKASERFDSLIFPHLAALVRTARFMCNDDADGDDLAQETLIKAFRAITTLDDETRAKPWLLSILRHVHLDQLRAARAHPHTSLDTLGWDLPGEAQTPDDSHDDKPWHEADVTLERFSDDHLICALKSIQKEIRWTLLLVDVEGLEEREAAQVLGVPLGTVKSRLFRGRQMLRDFLQPKMVSSA